MNFFSGMGGFPFGGQHGHDEDDCTIWFILEGSGDVDNVEFY